MAINIVTMGYGPAVGENVNIYIPTDDIEIEFDYDTVEVELDTDTLEVEITCQ